MQVSLYSGIFGNKYIQKRSAIPCSCPLPDNLYLSYMTEQFDIYDMNKIESNESLSLQMTFASILEYNRSVSSGLYIQFDWQLEGIHEGYSIVDSVLKSSIICWFKINCINKLKQLLNESKIPIPFSITPFNSILPSRYSSAAPFESYFFYWWNQYYYSLLTLFVNWTWRLNIYDNESNDPGTINRERLSTRLNFVILFILFYTLTIYSMIAQDRPINIVFSNPAESDYKKLMILYSTQLQYPRQKISVEYKYFTDISTTFHQIC
ncbi:hypothetical protein I4U23_028674 [Adineta vaga]|nr:hypothetical protein I4U23_028674 [Adineta vaga]